jgi:hypothetical protein
MRNTVSLSVAGRELRLRRIAKETGQVFRKLRQRRTRLPRGQLTYYLINGALARYAVSMGRTLTAYGTLEDVERASRTGLGVLKRVLAGSVQGLRASEPSPESSQLVVGCLAQHTLTPEAPITKSSHCGSDTKGR